MATTAKNTAKPYRRSHCQRVSPGIGASLRAGYNWHALVRSCIDTDQRQAARNSQPGNTNALKHGFYSAAAEADRRRIRLAIRAWRKGGEGVG